MSTSPSVFPLAHIALTAAVTAGVAFCCWSSCVLRPADAMRFEQVRVLLMLVSSVINVVTI